MFIKMRYTILILLSFMAFNLSAQKQSFNFSDTYYQQDFKSSAHGTYKTIVGEYDITVNGKVYDIKDTMFEKSENAYINTAYKCTSDGQTFLVYVFRDLRSNEVMSISVARNGVKVSYYNLNRN